jgi:catechol 1,2-dioxygenase
MCDAVRQEFILLSDTFGVSALVEMMAYDPSMPTATDNTVLGPFYVPGSPHRAKGETMLVDPDDGDRVVVRGRVTNAEGQPIEGVTLDCFQNATNRFYAVQQPGVQTPENLRGVYTTDANGEYELRAVRPVPYPIPDDGPVGDLLKKNNRNWWRPGHLHVWTRKEGYKDLITHVFDVESEFLDSDAVFGVQKSLIREFKNDANGELEARFDIVLDRV